jgi:FkbM family methyltransferase
MARSRLLMAARIDLVIDVGANIGQFGEELRKYGYRERIVSLEPLSAPFAELMRKCARDSKWTAHNLAVGAQNGEAYINVSANSFSSSLLEVLPAIVEKIPKTKTIGRERIRISTLDALFSEISSGASNIFMKLDVQGTEKDVLIGAAASLPRIGHVQLEMSIEPFYSGEPCFPELDAQMRNLGYKLISIGPTLTNSATGEMLQVDGIYRRNYG